MFATLRQLSPAEALLMNEPNAEWKQLLKVTAMDLLLRHILVYYSKAIDGTDTGYVKAGSQFQKAALAAHERVFTDMFEKAPELETSFKQLVKAAYQKASHNRRYKKMVMQTERLQSTLSQSVWQWFTGKWSLTARGEQLSKPVRLELKQLEADLKQALETDKSRAIEIIKAVRGNIFLIPNLNWDTISQLGDEFALLFADLQQKDMDTDSGDVWIYTNWGDFDDISTDFNSGCASDGGDSSGCGGDSGCSGCGGCGGCGS